MTADRALAPGAVGPSKRWRPPPTQRWPASLRPTASRFGFWAAPMKNPWRPKSRRHQRPRSHRQDLRDAILALGAASVAISNDSGLLHVAAALGTPSIGFSARTSPWHWAPLNPLAAVIETKSELPCRPCTSRSAGSSTTAACATSIPTRFWPRPATHWQKPRQGRKCWHNAVSSISVWAEMSRKAG